MARLRISAGEIEFEVALVDSPTARQLVAAVPFESRVKTWGQEVYFSTPVRAALEPDARQVVEPGTVCFWTEGDSLVLPWGRTPISTDARPKLANPCNVLGRIVGDPGVLGAVSPGAKVRVEAL